MTRRRLLPEWSKEKIKSCEESQEAWDNWKRAGLPWGIPTPNVGKVSVSWGPQVGSEQSYIPKTIFASE